jgi:hypothetical protein
MQGGRAVSDFPGKLMHPLLLSPVPFMAAGNAQLSV